MHFFTCDHGSKVFFDDLGVPWPVHDCDASSTNRLRRWIDEHGRVCEEIAPDITFIKPPDFDVEPEVMRQARSRETRGISAPILPVLATPTGRETITGVLRELAPHADPFKAFNLPETTVGRALLGRIGKQPVGKLTVHAPAPSGEELESWTAWVPTRLIAGGEFARGGTVSVVLEGVRLPKEVSHWFCSSIELVVRHDL